MYGEKTPKYNDSLQAAMSSMDSVGHLLLKNLSFQSDTVLHSHSIGHIWSGGLVNKLQNIKLQNLRHMDLSSLKQLSDATLCAFLGIAPKLESLELASAPFLFSTSGYLGEAASSRPNSAALTFTRFIHEVDRLKATFKSLNISRTSVSDLSLESLCKIKGLNLKRLVLVSCKDLSDAGIVRLCAAQPGLVELNLASNAQLTGVSVKHVCMNLQLIKSLNLTKIRLHPNEFKPLIRLANCSQLILSACFQQQPAEADVEAAFRVWAPNMRSLDLSYCSGLSNKILVNMCQYLKGLTELDVSSCFRLDDVTVREISQKLNQLTQLRMGWCKHITDLGLLGFYHEDFTHDCTKECRCGRVRNEVYFEYTPPVRDIAPREIVPSQAQIESAKVKHGETGAYPISLLTNLSVLDLTMCTKLTDASISSVVKFARLKSLGLSMCSRITDRSLIAIASNNPLLEIVDVSQCRELTDQAIFALVAGCRRLTHINLSGCPKITDTSIESMVKRRVKLKFLDVSMCNISLESIEMLERLVPTLQTIHKLYTSVPDHANSKMKSKCSKK